MDAEQLSGRVTTRALEQGRAMFVQGSLHSSVVAAVVREYVRRGVAADVLKQHGLTRDFLADPKAKLSLPRFVGMFEDMADSIDNPSFGAESGLAIQPVDLGFAGMIVTRSCSIMAALDRLTRFMATLQPDTQTALFEEDGMVTWTYRLGDAAIWPRRQDAEFTLSSLIHLIRSAFSKHWRPRLVQLEHGPLSLKHAHSLERLLGCPIQFEAASNGLMLPLEEALVAFRDEDFDLITVMERYLSDLKSAETVHKSWSSRVLALIGTRLGRQPVTLDAIAADLAMAPRSLQRRLAEEGASLRRLLRQHRQTLAEQQLGVGKRHLGNLAATLGYADSTTFWRARRSWKGMPSGAVRGALGLTQQGGDTAPQNLSSL